MAKWWRREDRDECDECPCVVFFFLPPPLSPSSFIFPFLHHLLPSVLILGAGIGQQRLRGLSPVKSSSPEQMEMDLGEGKGERGEDGLVPIVWCRTFHSLPTKGGAAFAHLRKTSKGTFPRSGRTGFVGREREKRRYLGWIGILEPSTKWQNEKMN